jgi:hypothetical protein
MLQAKDENHKNHTIKDDPNDTSEEKQHNNFIAAYGYFNNLCLFSTAHNKCSRVGFWFFHWAIKSSPDSVAVYSWIKVVL